MRRIWWAIVSVLCITVLAMVPVVAENAAVTVGVGDTILRVEGRTSPDAFVTISRDGSVIGTTTAGADGGYGHTFPAQSPGLHQLSVVARTVSGADTDTITTTVDITEHGTTTVSLFLPPTLAITNPTPGYGEPLQLQGETAPSSTVSIYIDNAVYITTMSDAAGAWNLEIATVDLAAGQHALFVRATDSLGAQSYPSRLHQFTLAAAPGVPSVPMSPPFIQPGGAGPAGSGLGVPIITDPANGAVQRQPGFVVRGLADPAVQVELWSGDTNFGSVWSDAQGNWLLSPTLAPGDYQFRARACLAGVCSGFSDTVRVTYAPDIPVVPLIIVAPKSSFSVSQGQPLTIRATIVGGAPPFTAVLHWGDGTHDTITVNQGILEFTHRYQNPGNYTLSLEATDREQRSGKVPLTVHVSAALPWAPFVGVLVVVAAAVGVLLYRAHVRRAPRR